MSDPLPHRDVGAVVTAGGSGSRFGGLKQFERLGERSVLAHAVDVAASVAGSVVVPVPLGQEEVARAQLRGSTAATVPGGATRALSVLAGLQRLRQNPDLVWVLVHDAARPRASADLFRRVLAAAQRVGAAIPGLRSPDTVRRIEGELLTETLDRASICLVQTPQAFRLDDLLAGYARLGEAAKDCSDEGAIYAVLGQPIAWVEGEVQNHKLTHPHDLTAMGPPAKPPLPRIGIGYDVHPFAPGRRLVLGGLEFEGDGLAGDSDADIVAHAVTDAILGAAALGDLGRHFPPGDPRFTGARSLELLATAVALAAGAGLRVGNVDLTIAARRPKIAPRANAIGAALAQVLGVAPSDVNVKATTGDGLGFVGRAEGIAVHAVALLYKVQP